MAAVIVSAKTIIKTAFMKTKVFHSGFTLLEVMIAVAILSTGIISLSSSYSMAARTTRLVIGYEKARLLAQQKLAVFLSQPSVKETRQQGEDQGMNWEIVSCKHPERPNLLTITARIYFHGPGGRRTLELVTRQLLCKFD
jgi:prepilin-type N-terminal cleavage/methylation domain-containing protein